ncbi:hypothetical protein BST96_10015 [Oceanicoccus sagamiensis]|uniref:Uncharacterized protein n=1 Tax=Oceanicoccus sagamiensis TaxID=716816 RepID=A0A1X9NH88_9GAMM|nr:hypothetical protein BST96_10015 [Oceanicoccus sagamiensis]
MAYWYGGLSIKADYQELLAAHEKAVKQLSLVEARYDDASQQLTNAKLGSDIDREAVNDVRTTVSEHKETINQLNEEINFYKGLMAPTERERGLGIRSWEIYLGSEPNRFQYKLVLQQLALKHTVLKGTVKVNIVGRRNGVEETLSLDILSEQVDKILKLRFKYFQYLEGELIIPEGFTPDRIDIVAKATSPKAVTVEKQYGWIVQK